jgi:hypothetical protein
MTIVSMRQIYNKLLCPTRGIKHWGLSGYASILPRIKFGVTRQESSPQSPTISYRHTLAVMQEETTINDKGIN